MELKINDKDIEIVFGLAFNRELDILHKVQGNGLTFGAGLDTVIPEVLSGSVVALSEIIYHGTAHIKKGRPSGNQVDAFVEKHENLDELFEQVMAELSEANVSKKKVKQWKEQLNLK